MRRERPAHRAGSTHATCVAQPWRAGRASRVALDVAPADAAIERPTPRCPPLRAAQMARPTRRCVRAARRRHGGGGGASVARVRRRTWRARDVNVAPRHTTCTTHNDAEDHDGRGHGRCHGHGHGRDVGPRRARARYLTSLVCRGVRRRATFGVRRYLVVVVVVLVRERRRGTCVSGRAP